MIEYYLNRQYPKIIHFYHLYVTRSPRYTLHVSSNESLYLWNIIDFLIYYLPLAQIGSILGRIHSKSGFLLDWNISRIQSTPRSDPIVLILLYRLPTESGYQFYPSSANSIHHCSIHSHHNGSLYQIWRAASIYMQVVFINAASSCGLHLLIQLHIYL